MNDDVDAVVKQLVAQSVGGEYRNQKLSGDTRLIGNILDSMAVTSLIAALEDQFGFKFEDEDLTAETFDTVASLIELVRKKHPG